MFLGKTTELKQLNDSYAAAGNKAVVLYGAPGIGKTTLALEFAKNHPHIYFFAKELSEQEQLLSFAAENGSSFDVNSPAESYLRILKENAMRNSGMKTVFVLDEFQYMFKNGTGFKEAFIELMQNKEMEGSFMFLFLSSSVNWVENSMVEYMGNAIKMLSGFVKLKEWTFTEMMDRFPNQKMENIIYAGAVLGGVPGLLDYWNDKQSFRENVIRLFLTKRAPLRTEAERFLKSELRELPAYNAILATIAAGNYKLNDIYERTGFSRAKISVYLKNLIELDIVEKVFSFETGDKENVKKGLYNIKNRYLCFWYRYVFPNLSLLELGMEKEVYDNIIAYDINEFMHERFAEVCLEYMKLMSDLGKLSRKYDNWGKWYGKAGDIDIVASDAAGNMLVGFCSFSNKRLTMTEYRKYKELMELAGITKGEVYVFAKSGFEQELKTAAAKDGVMLINLDEF